MSVKYGMEGLLSTEKQTFKKKEEAKNIKSYHFDL